MTVIVAPGLTHKPRRPKWSCSSCDEGWPCRVARAELLEGSERNSLDGSLYLASCLRLAVDDSFFSRGPEPEGLWHRMLGWYAEACFIRRASLRAADSEAFE